MKLNSKILSPYFWVMLSAAMVIFAAGYLFGMSEPAEQQMMRTLNSCVQVPCESIISQNESISNLTQHAQWCDLCNLCTGTWESGRNWDE
jgi:hypothetical protein